MTKYMPKLGTQKHVIFLLLIIAVLAVSVSLLITSLKTNPVDKVLESDQIIKAVIVLEDDGNALATMIMAYYPVSHKGALIDILGNTGAIYASLGRVCLLYTSPSPRDA